jgi:PadR family transcriptional regulator PadR
MLILKVVALGPIHGYGVSQRIQRMSNDLFRVRQGALYPTLQRLENRGWLQADSRQTETGREAQFYSLTKEGRKQLEAKVANWDRLSNAVASILHTAE